MALSGCLPLLDTTMHCYGSLCSMLLHVKRIDSETHIDPHNQATTCRPNYTNISNTFDPLVPSSRFIEQILSKAEKSHLVIYHP